jgi:hypothetical protein
MTDKTESQLEQALIDAALNWASAQRAQVPPEQKRELEELISASSLGTPEAIAIRAQADPEVVKQALRRADEIEAEAAYWEIRNQENSSWNYEDEEACFVAGFLKARGHG